MPNDMGGVHFYTPKSIFQHTMNRQSINQQNESQWLWHPHVPPMSMPWSMPPCQKPDLVRFTGERTPQSFEPLVHQKRKLEAPDVVVSDVQPTKQFITDEKMAQHFRGLQISPNVTNLHELEPSTSTKQNFKETDFELNLLNSDDIDDKRTTPRLIISEEIKRLREEPILPPSLLSKLERPTMALMLWKPPSKYLHILSNLRDASTPTSSGVNNNNNDNNGLNSNRTNSNNNSINNNNNEGIPNLNQSMDVNISDMNLEPMDL